MGEQTLILSGPCSNAQVCAHKTWHTAHMHNACALHGGFSDAEHDGCFCSQLNMSMNLLRLSRLTLHIEESFVSYCPENAKWA